MIQRLELVDRLFPALFSGEKTDTLRWKEGDVSEGYLLYYATENPRWQVLVWVTKVSTCKLGSLSGRHGKTSQELLASMRTHYPDIELDTEILRVEHLSPQETVRLHGIPAELEGKLVLTVSDL